MTSVIPSWSHPHADFFPSRHPYLLRVSFAGCNISSALRFFLLREVGFLSPMLRKRRADLNSSTFCTHWTNGMWVPAVGQTLLEPRVSALATLLELTFPFLWIVWQWMPVNSLGLRIFEVSLGAVTLLELAPACTSSVYLASLSPREGVFFKLCWHTLWRKTTPGPGVATWARARHLNFLNSFPHLSKTGNFYRRGCYEL